MNGSIAQNLLGFKSDLPEEVTLVAVSKTKPVSDLMKAYNSGQRIFGENKVQEMTQKWEVMPKDIQWHMIGHLQTNKVKYIASFVGLIHSLDRLKLAKEINRQGERNKKIIDCLVQIKIAEEDSKFGMSPEDFEEIKKHLPNYQSINIIGLMGMATANVKKNQTKKEFDFLHEIFKKSNNLNTLCMGMSQDYKIANECGSNMFRIGSFIFN